MPDQLYKVSEVAKRLGTNNNYVYALIESGLLPALKIGHMKVRREALIAFQKKWEGWDLRDPFNPVEMKR